MMKSMKLFSDIAREMYPVSEISILHDSFPTMITNIAYDEIVNVREKKCFYGMPE